MALENLTPSNRMEAILDGQDIEPSNRKEYFMQKAVSAGGSSLPSYSSADIGKVLTVGEGDGDEPEPKWEAAGGGIFKVLADYSTGALDKNFREIEAAITGGLLPVVFSQGASFPVILATLTNGVYTVCALSASPSSTQATLIKWGAALPTAPLTQALPTTPLA